MYKDGDYKESGDSWGKLDTGVGNQGNDQSGGGSKTKHKPQELTILLVTIPLKETTNNELYMQNYMA